MARENPGQEALARLGFETMGQISCGTWNGYAATLRHSAPYYYLDLAARLDKKDKTTPKAIRDALKQRFPKIILGCVNSDGNLTITFTLNKKQILDDQLKTVLEAGTAAAREQGVVPADTCAVCGKDHPDSLCLVSSYQPVHAACVRELTENTKHDAEENEQKGSYLTGIIGGVIGALVGLVPSLLSILFADRIYAALFALVPLASMWGYRKLRGKRNAAAIVIVVILSLLSVIALECIVVAISIKQEFGLGLVSALDVATQYLFSAEGIGVLLQESLSEFLFMALGIFLAWKFLAQTNHGRVAAANAVSRTLRPIDASLDDPDWSEK